MTDELRSPDATEWLGRHVGLMTAVFLATIVAFSGSLTHPFLKWDDQYFLIYNTAYRGLDWSHLRWMFTTMLLGPYQPLSWLSYAVDYSVWGLNPFGFHLTNVLLHGAGAVMMFLLARRLLALAMPSARDTSDLQLAAALSALLFSIHPLRVESVAWAAERRDVLSGVFYLASVNWYVRYGEATGGRRASAYALAVLLYLFALLSKATGMTLPLVLLILDVYPLKRIARGVDRFRASGYLILEKLPFFVFAVAAGWIALRGQQAGGTEKMPDLAGLDIGARAAIACYAACFYVLKELVPIGLGPLYELRFKVDSTLPVLWPWLSVVGVLTIAVLLRRRRWPGVASAWMAYLLLLAPVSGISQVGMQLAADRYTYLPCIPLALLGGGGLLLIRSRAARRTVEVALASVLIVLFGMTVRQVRYWRDTEVLWARAVEVDPSCFHAHLNLAAFAFSAGDRPRGRHHVEQALRVRGEEPLELRQLGIALEQVGAKDEALSIHSRAASLEPMSADAVVEYGSMLYRAGRLSEAADQFERVLARSPRHVQSLLGMAAIRADQRSMKSAADFAELAMTADAMPASGYLAIAELWRRAGQPRRAEDALRRGIEKFPDDAANVSTLAWMLATHPDSDLRDGRESIRLAERLTQIDDGDIARAQSILAAALAETGRLDEARAAFARAAQIVRRESGGTLPEYMLLIEQSLRDGRPVRDMPLTARD